MRHLIKAHATGHPLAGTGGRIAELGPGDSLGIGLAAMLSGFNEYFALDAKAHANVERNLEVFGELCRLFIERAPVPGEEEFPLTFPKLQDYSFPAAILTDRILASTLHAQRIESISAAIKGQTLEQDDRIQLAYIAPWTDRGLLERESLDVVFSQAVLEHVDDIAAAYAAMHYWLRPGGFMSHTIDYMSHGLTRDWNGHWTVGDFRWHLVRGRRPYLINRLPHSVHVAAMTKAGFQIARNEVQEGRKLDRACLADRFRHLSEADLKTCGSYIQALKPVASVS
jgi:SAM-dependent methyltransferase